MTIRSLGDTTAMHLRARASAHGTSREQEARDTLHSGLSTEPVRPHDLGQTIHERFAALGGVDLPEISRQPSREPPSFEA